MKCDIVYGDTGSTKTSRLGDAAEYYIEKTGKPVRLVNSDPGGGLEVNRSLIEEGKIIPFNLTFERQYLIEDIDKLSMGWWPEDASNPTSKLAPPKLDGVSALFFDSATFMCRMVYMLHLSAVKVVNGNLVATNIRVPEMPKDSFTQSGEFVRRFSGRSDYGGVQDRIREAINKSSMLPVPVIWTALEDKGKDDATGAPVNGPEFIGHALTGSCGHLFANMLHLDMWAHEEEHLVEGKKVMVNIPRPVMFTRAHIRPNDPTKTPFMAKPRVDKRLWAKVKPVMKPDLKEYYLLLDQIQLEAKEMGAVSLQSK